MSDRDLNDLKRAIELEEAADRLEDKLLNLAIERDTMKMTKKIEKKLPILTAPRFWVIVVIAAVEAARSLGWLDPLVVNVILTFVETVAGAAGVVNTIDKVSKRIGRR